MRVRWIQTLLVISVIAGVAFGISRLLRNPVEDLSTPDISRSRRSATQGGSRSVASVARPAPPSEAYVGSTACAECHADIHSRYQSHPMGRSLSHVLAAEPLEEYSDEITFDTPPHPRWDLRLKYQVERRADGILHHEVVVDGTGDVVYDQAVPAHYAVGSGQRGRSYVTNRDGLLFMSPITWYSQKRRWDLSPGYELENPGFERPIVDGCINCHAGRLAFVPGQPNHFREEPFLEESIGCERCHGPGDQHASLHRRGVKPGEDDPIVNPVDLEAGLRDSVCFQCHLQGAQRVLRYGRTEFDFRPGDHLNDIWTVFVSGTGIAEDQTTEAVSQVEQMLASTCYQESAGRLGCVSCHDPHSLPEPEARVEFYRSQCLQCHDQGQAVCSEPIAKRREVTAEDSCIACHMPPIAANDVPHTSQTDHRILRSPEGRTRPHAENGSRYEIFEQESGRTPALELDRARAILLVVQAERSKAAALLAADAISNLERWLAAAPDDDAALEALGTAQLLLKNHNAAYETFSRALAINPDNESVLRRMAALCHDHGRIQEGAEYARRLIELNPWNHTHFGRLAHMLGQLGQFREAIQAGRRAIELKPGSALIHGWLSEAYALVGDTKRSREHRELAEKLQLPQ